MQEKKIIVSSQSFITMESGMRKFASALSLMGLGLSASAQSSITISGIVDTAISHFDVESSFVPRTLADYSRVGSRTTRQNQNVVASGGLNTSRLAFRGMEDLGGGLAAGFWLESALAMDTGGTTLAFLRRSTVSLYGDFGEVRLGRHFVPTYFNDYIFDPWGNSGVAASAIYAVRANLQTVRSGITPVAQPGVQSLGGSTTGTGLGASATDGALRASNSIGYFLPNTLGGFYGHFMYALPEAVSIDDTFTGNRGKYVGGRFGWTGGPADVAASYGVSTTSNSLSYTEKLKTMNLGASYDFGVVKMMGELSRTIDDVTSVSSSPLTSGLRSDRYDGVLVGANIPVGPGVIKASYSRVKYKKDPGTFVATSAYDTSGNASVDKLALGYVHYLSKRTQLYATIARVKVKEGQNNQSVMGVAVNNSAFQYSGQGAIASPWAPRKSTGYEIGISHSF
jgi:predicted porin